MRQAVIYLLILIGGIGIGYAINQSFNNSVEIKTKTETDTVIVEKIKKQFIIDTIEVEKIVYSSNSSDNNFSEMQEYSDTLTFEEVNNSYSTEDVDEIIIKEQLVSQRTISLEPLPNDSTDVSKLLEMKSNAFSKDIIVEFWQSPLNITGYELSRNKLKLFGFNPDESISLRLGNEEDQLFLNTESMSLLLQKTKQFKTLRLR